MSVAVLTRADVRAHLDFSTCIGLMRGVMIALSRGETMQAPRQIMPLGEGNMLGVMPGALGATAPFGVKVVAVYPANFARGLPSHQGAVLLFDPGSGPLVAVVDATEITRIRTASASAAATDALARADASRLAVLGYGEQAEAHVQAIREVRAIDMVTVWGRDPDRRATFARHLNAQGIAAKSRFR